ncbi:rRNA small subunit methyltransferase, glucose inhibited division protein GidB [Micavibrio aeruginosavorus EPB]|uniref:Ribosomal RNA small subunit methyltransferase G n=2 Tax=Micavibrio aeruginosavorus TaxID=349221 RepID=M4VBS7_9BACT|nr:rRNA small subunit methyltransferase, glucose inhibited division protein GidB [Micavibrio aeruginosavorus EPB]
MTVMSPNPLTIPAVSRETEEKLSHYRALLEKWQAAINLVSPATLPEADTRHFKDSLQVLPLVPVAAQTLYDLGSGAGFPGLVLAIARPDLAVTLVESDQKKCSFLSTVSRETKAGATIANERIEMATANRPAPDVITARALAALPALLDLVAPWVAANPAITLIFPKGARAEEEVAEARKTWAFDLAEHQSATDPAARILVLAAICAKS